MKKTPALKSKIILPVAIVFLLCAVWMIALNTGLAHAESRIVTQIEYSSYPVPEPVYIEVEKLVPTVTTIEVDRPVYIEKEVEVPREVPVMLKDWDSPEQLAEFLKNDDTDGRIILQADSSGAIAFNGQCEDLALQLRDRAMAIGKYLSVQVLNPKEYEKWYGIKVRSDVYHAICMARIGNQFWYIEPANDKHWSALNLD
jgi:hypothetical protein